MREMAISKFKAECLGVLDEVGKTGEPVLVTRFGVPVAEVVPPRKARRKKSWLGAMANPMSGVIVGDIVSPSTDPEEWDVLRD